MAALTKAEMAEALFDQLGLNKREARELVDLFFERFVPPYHPASRSNCPGSGISICGTRIGARGATRRPVRKFPSARVALLHSVRARS